MRGYLKKGLFLYVLQDLFILKSTQRFFEPSFLLIFSYSKFLFAFRDRLFFFWHHCTPFHLVTVSRLSFLNIARVHCLYMYKSWNSKKTLIMSKIADVLLFLSRLINTT